MERNSIYKSIVKRQRGGKTSDQGIKIGDITSNLLQVSLDFNNITVLDGRGEDGESQGSEDEESRAELDHIANAY